MTNLTENFYETFGPRKTGCVFSTMKTISEMPDFEVEAGDVKVKMILEWRGMDGAFWNAHVGTRGIFRPAVEIDLEQARAVAAAVAEFDRRVKGDVCRERDALLAVRQWQPIETAPRDGSFIINVCDITNKVA